MNQRQRKKKFKKGFTNFIPDAKTKVKRGMLFKKNVIAVKVTYNFS